MRNDIQKESHDLVSGFFKGNEARTYNWFRNKNPLLGGVSPADMILLGREEKLLKFIKNSLAGNME